MDNKTATDEALLRGLQQKDLEALEEFYDRHHRTALAVAIRVLGDRNLAEDVIQEAFLAVWRQADTYNSDRGNARSWFLSIVRHRAIDVTRGKGFARDRVSLDEIRHEPRYPDTWHEIDANFERERIREALDTLPQEQKDAVSLAYFGGFTQREIAERTGVPLGTVKGRMRMAMQKLRNLLADVNTGEDD